MSRRRHSSSASPLPKVVFDWEDEDTPTTPMRLPNAADPEWEQADTIPGLSAWDLDFDDGADDR